MLRFFVFRRLSNFIPGNNLRKLYTGFVRSVLEYTSITYGPMLTQYQSNELENIQKRCLRCMYGYEKSYEELLRESGFKTLSDRRESAIRRFAERTSTNPVYARWFQENQNRQSLRNPRKFEEKMARTNRLYNSPLFTVRRTLNDTATTEGPEMLTAFEAPLNDPFLT